MFPATFVALISTFEKSCPCPPLAASPANAPPPTSIKLNSCLRMRIPPRRLLVHSARCFSPVVRPSPCRRRRQDRPGHRPPSHCLLEYRPLRFPLPQ